MTSGAPITSREGGDMNTVVDVALALYLALLLFDLAERVF